MIALCLNKVNIFLQKIIFLRIYTLSLATTEGKLTAKKSHLKVRFSGYSLQIAWLQSHCTLIKYDGIRNYWYSILRKRYTWGTSHFKNIWKKRHIASTFDGCSKFFLICERHSRIVSWDDTIEFRKILFEKRSIFIIYDLYTCGGYRAWFFYFFRHNN